MENINSKKKIYYITIFFISYLTFDFFTKDYFKSISMKFFFSKDKSRCEYFIYSDYIEQGIKYFMYYLSLNYINLYSSIFMIFMETLSIFIISNLKIIYQEVKPSLKHPEFPSCVTFSSFGTPSSTASSMFILFGVFYKGMTQKYNIISYKFYCGLLWTIVVIYSSLVRMLQNTLYLNQVIFGLVIGYVIYYIFFHILKVNLMDFNQLKIFLDYKFTVIFCTILLFGFNTFFQFVITKPFLKNKSNNFINQNYLSQTILFEFLGYYIGMLLEYLINFKSNDIFFDKYNIKEVNINGIEMFNHTKRDVSLFRFLLFCFIDYYLTLTIPTNIDFLDCSSYINLIFSLPLFYRTLKGILIFFVLKFTIRFLGLTNEKINEGYFNLKIKD